MNDAATDPRNPSTLALQTALALLLGYLFQQVRMKDGVPSPPLLDRDDFLAYVESAIDAPAGAWSQDNIQGLRWLVKLMREIGALRPGELDAQ